MAKDILSAMGSAITPVAFGGPPHSQVAQAAKALGVDCFDDLRQTLIDKPPRYLLLAGCDTVQEEVFIAANDASIRVLTLDPVAATFSGLSARAPKKSNSRSIADMLPSFEQAASVLNLGQIDDHLGGRRLVKAVGLGPDNHQDLFTRLYDLWSIILHFVDPPESISASLSGPTSSDHSVPDNPRRLSGHMAVHGRGLSGSAVLLHVGITPDPTEERHLQVFGDRGRLTLTENGFDLSDDFDDFHDQAVFDTAPSASFAEACAAQWRQMLVRPCDHPGRKAAMASEHDEQTLACCLACQLSARTGQSESPFTVAQMGR